MRRHGGGGRKRSSGCVISSSRGDCPLVREGWKSVNVLWTPADEKAEEATTTEVLPLKVMPMRRLRSNLWKRVGVDEHWNDSRCCRWSLVAHCRRRWLADKLAAEEQEGSEASSKRAKRRRRRLRHRSRRRRLRRQARRIQITRADPNNRVNTTQANTPRIGSRTAMMATNIAMKMTMTTTCRVGSTAIRASSIQTRG